MPLLVYHQAVAADIAPFPLNIKVRLKKAIETRIAREPLLFGEPLRLGLTGLRKLRVGDYRVVYELHKATIRIWGIEHRRKVYPIIKRRRRRPFRS